MIKENKTNTFIRLKPRRILISVEGKINKSRVAKVTDTTFSNTSKLLKKMEGRGLLEQNLDGRSKFITLTTKGIKVKELFLEFDRILNDTL